MDLLIPVLLVSAAPTLTTAIRDVVNSLRTGLVAQAVKLLEVAVDVELMVSQKICSISAKKVHDKLNKLNGVNVALTQDVHSTV